MLKKSLAVTLLLLSMSFGAYAMPCHCFSDREFNAEAPFEADPYFLATTENSFFAHVFEMPKKKVVLAKQKRTTTSEMLWTAYWIGRKTGQDGKAILAQRKSDGNWNGVLAVEGADGKKLPADFMTLVASHVADAELSRYVVDALLVEMAVAPAEQLTELRAAGANDAQTILSAILGLQSRKAPLGFFLPASQEQTSWGQHLLAVGIAGTEMEEEIARLLPKN